MVEALILLALALGVVVGAGAVRKAVNSKADCLGQEVRTLGFGQDDGCRSSAAAMPSMPMPAAQLQVPSPQPAAAPAGAKSAEPRRVVTGLGDDVDAVINRSPIYARKVRLAQQAGYRIMYGEKNGEGSYANRDEKFISIEPGGRDTLDHLSHELGHALSPGPPSKFPTSRAQWVTERVNWLMANEGEAELTRIELSRSAGFKMRGEWVPAEESIYDRYRAGEISRQKARAEIGELYANLNPSTSPPNETYREYYQTATEKLYDEWKAARDKSEASPRVAAERPTKGSR